MTWIERIERVARIALWLALASAAVIAPLSYVRLRHAESDTAESARKLAEAARKDDEETARKAKERADRPERLTLASMGPGIRALNEAHATGMLWFTNASSRSGELCVSGVATNGKTSASTASLPACKMITPYATNVEITMMFAGGDLAQVCKGGGCELTLQEVPDSVPRPSPTPPPTAPPTAQAR